MQETGLFAMQAMQFANAWLQKAAWLILETANLEVP